MSVTVNNGRTFYPSFTDLYRIILAIGKLEDERYPEGRGRRKIVDFMRDAQNGMTFEQLVFKHNIPVTNNNGERLDPWRELGREECLRLSGSSTSEYQQSFSYLDLAAEYVNNKGKP